jgi:uncharacterized protein (TIGR03083 family)
MAGAGPVVADLRAESDDLDALVAPLPADRWADPTPAPGWTVAHQIGHLLWTDRVALTAATDEARFAEALAAAQAARREPGPSHRAPVDEQDDRLRLRGLEAARRRAEFLEPDEVIVRRYRISGHGAFGGGQQQAVEE